MVKIFWWYVYQFWQFTNVMDTQTQTLHDGIGRTYAQHHAAKIIQYFDEIWYTTADIEPDDSHVTKNRNF